MSECPNCGQENNTESNFCDNCGSPLTKSPSQTKENAKTSRTIEMILGILGGVFGLLGGVFALIFAAFAPSVGGLGLSAVLASIVGLVGAIYVGQNPKIGGIILIISAIWLLISISVFGVLGAALLGIAGLMALIRK
jgi:hypothetical protein